MTVPRVGLNGEGNGSDDIDDSDYSVTDYWNLNQTSTSLSLSQTNNVRVYWRTAVRPWISGRLGPGPCLKMSQDSANIKKLKGGKEQYIVLVGGWQGDTTIKY